MNYSYTDHHGDTVTVKAYDDGVWITINEGRGGAAVAMGMAEAQRFTDAVMDAVIQTGVL